MRGELIGLKADGAVNTVGIAGRGLADNRNSVPLHKDIYLHWLTVGWPGLAVGSPDLINCWVCKVVES